MLFNPGVPHLLQGHIGREISIMIRAIASALSTTSRRTEAYPVRECVDADHKRRGILSLILQGIGIQFGRLIEKLAEQGFSLFLLVGRSLRSSLRPLRRP